MLQAAPPAFLTNLSEIAFLLIFFCQEADEIFGVTAVPEVLPADDAEGTRRAVLRKRKNQDSFFLPEIPKTIIVITEPATIRKHKICPVEKFRSEVLV